MRAPHEHERPLLAYLFSLASISVDLDALEVESMTDGGMGSLLIGPSDRIGRKRGSTCAECHFYDVDDMPVSILLILDDCGLPFEIDVWKVDFSKTVGWPLTNELRQGPPNE